MFPKVQVRPALRVDHRGRLHHMHQYGRRSASHAKGRIVPVTRHAREVAAYRLLDAREWSAPRLERAADYVETELGPRVGSLLTRTARKVEPSRPSHRSRNATLMMLAAIGLAGVLGALMTRRNAMTGPSRTEDPMDPVDPMPKESEHSADGQIPRP